MKAIDYLDKWYDKLVNAGEKENEVLTEIILDFSHELISIKKQRNAHKNEAIISLLKEQNQKYNKFCRLVNGKLGFNYLKEDGYKNYFKLSNISIAAYLK